MSFESIGKRETLPEKVSKTIKESILQGELKGGEALPTEPELEKQFGVSRAVIRDAIRMLMAQGLVEVKHGKGMYVSHSQIDAFTDALLTTLRRDKASVWDVEQFEQIFLPQIFALAAESASDSEKKDIRRLGTEYLKQFKKLIESEQKAIILEIEESAEKANALFRDFMLSIFDGTHNKMVRLIGEVLISMRKWRTITDLEEGDERVLKTEVYILEKYMSAIDMNDGAKSAELVSTMLSYSKNLSDILKNTPIGTSPEIPGDIFYTSYKEIF